MKNNEITKLTRRFGEITASTQVAAEMENICYLTRTESLTLGQDYIVLITEILYLKWVSVAIGIDCISVFKIKVNNSVS